jgi:hypothetical protein
VVPWMQKLVIFNLLIPSLEKQSYKY